MSPHRASIEERINWSTGFTRPADKVVLGALATWADYESGRNARPGMPELVARADLPKRTVERSLRRLIDERWITVTGRRHLGYTTYAINLAKLATSATRARLVDRPLSANVADNADDPLSANVAGLSANLAELSANVADVPVISTRDQYPSAPARVAPAPPSDDNAIEVDVDAAVRLGWYAVPQGAGNVFARGDNGLAATQGAPMADGAADVRANGHDREDDDRGAPARGLREPGRADQAAARGARVPVPDRADRSRDRRADGSGAAVQQSFLPPCVKVVDADDFAPIVADPRPRQVDRFVTLGEVWRANLEARRKRAASS